MLATLTHLAIGVVVALAIVLSWLVLMYVLAMALVFAGAVALAAAGALSVVHEVEEGESLPRTRPAVPAARVRRRWRRR